MLAKIIAWFETPEEEAPSLSSDEAATALMVEIMLADHELDEREEAVIAERLRHRTGEPMEAVKALLATAKQHHSESSDLFQFTKVINNSLEVDQKYDLIVDLWRTAWADGAVHPNQDHMIRRIADLLHLHHSHFIKAKHEAQGNL